MPIMPPVFWIVVAAIFGAIIGSFVNMAAYRLPRYISVVKRTRSFCPKCQRQLAWYENIPIISYLCLWGRCRTCRAPIGIRYLLTEVTVSALFAVSAYQYFSLNGGWSRGLTFPEPLVLFLVQLFLIADMVLLSVVDLEAWLIPYETTMPGLILGFILAPICPELHLSASTWTNIQRLDALIDSGMGLVLGAGILWAVGFLTTFGSFYWYRWRGIDERPREGMGLGDVHLMGMVGALLGWKPALCAILIGVMIGATTGVAKILWEKLMRRIKGDAYKPRQPTYDFPDNPEELVPERFWPLGAYGALILVGCGFLWQQSNATANAGGPDPRMFAVYPMIFIGLLLLLAFPFMKYLQSIDKLPQGDIVESEEGEKEEVMEGNYVPFGPSLALAVIIVAFYDPMIRVLAYHFVTSGRGTTGPVPLPIRPPGGAPVYLFFWNLINDFMHWMQKLVGS